MKGLNLEVEVGPILKQYIENCLQMDVVVSSKRWVILDIIKPYLQVRSKQLDMFDNGDKKINNDKSGTIKIEVPLFHCRAFNRTYGKVIYLDGIYHTVITDEGQAVLRRHFKQIMRQSFRVYMDGYTAAWEEFDKKKIKSGIVSYFSEYEINFTEKDVSAFARDWLRYRNKKYEGRISPILF